MHKLLFVIPIAVLAAAITWLPETFRSPPPSSPSSQPIVRFQGFLPNAGQLDPQVLFVARGKDTSVFLTREKVVVNTVAPQQKKGHAWSLGFHGMSPRMEVRTRGAGTRVNYLVGNQASKWKTGLEMAQEVTYAQLWPGVDLTLRWKGTALHMHFAIAAGANPQNIRFDLQGIDAPKLENGGLRLDSTLGTFALSAPKAHLAQGEKHAVRFAFEQGRLQLRSNSINTSSALNVDWELIAPPATGVGDGG